MDGLINRNIWKKFSRDGVPQHFSVVGGCFVLTLKNSGTPEECAKVRYIVQGYVNDDKPYLILDVTTLRPSSIRLVLA